MVHGVDPKRRAVVAEVEGIRQRLGPRVSYDTVRERVGVMLAQRQLAQGFAVKTGVIALLQQLHERGVPCGVASSTERAEVERRLQLAA